jgi:hypothetical protein
MYLFCNGPNPREISLKSGAVARLPRFISGLFACFENETDQDGC